MLRGPQINNMPDKSHVIIIIINIQGQIIQFFNIQQKKLESMMISQPIMSRTANVFAARPLASFVEGSLFLALYINDNVASRNELASLVQLSLQ